MAKSGFCRRKAAIRACLVFFGFGGFRQKRPYFRLSLLAISCNDQGSILALCLYQSIMPPPPLPPTGFRVSRSSTGTKVAIIDRIEVGFNAQGSTQPTRKSRRSYDVIIQDVNDGLSFTVVLLWLKVLKDFHGFRSIFPCVHPPWLQNCRHASPYSDCGYLLDKITLNV